MAVKWSNWDDNFLFHVWLRTKLMAFRLMKD